MVLTRVMIWKMAPPMATDMPLIGVTYGLYLAPHTSVDDALCFISCQWLTNSVIVFKLAASCGLISVQDYVFK